MESAEESLMRRIREAVDALVDSVLTDHARGDIVSTTTIGTTFALRKLLERLDALPSKP